MTIEYLWISLKKYINIKHMLQQRGQRRVSFIVIKLCFITKGVLNSHKQV